MVISGSQETHFYTPAGDPAYNVTLSVARSRGLYPSSTQVGKIIQKQGLENWKIEEHLKVMLQILREHPDFLQHPEVEILREVQDRFQNSNTETTELGVRMHDYLEREISGKVVRVEDRDRDMWEPVKEWLGAYRPNGITEKRVVGRGYAGRLDFLGLVRGEMMLGDFKTQFVKKYRKQQPRKGEWEFFGKDRLYARIYPEWIAQLASYRNACIDMGLVAGMVPVFSLVISTNPSCPGVAMYRWNPEETAAGWDRFYATLKLWYLLNEWEEPR